MMKCKLFLIAVTSIFCSGAFAQISIQVMTDPKDNCKQVMVSSQSNHVWQIDLSYKYVGKTSDGTPWDHAFTIPITVSPQANYHWVGSGLVDCNQRYEFNYSWTGYDATARAEQEAKRIDDSRKEVIRKYLEHEEEVKRQNEEFKRKKEAEAEARRQAELDRKRKVLQQQQYMKELEAKSRNDRLVAYRNASPENARCLISEPADIARCEQAKARERDERLKQEADALQARKQQEAERVATANVEQASIDGVARAARDMEANNCAFAAGLTTLIPYPTVNTNNAQYQADIKRIDALNFEAQQRFFRETKAASDACDARRAGNAAIQQQQQQQLLQQQQALRVQAEQQKRLLAQQKAQADLNAAIQEGKKTVGEAVKNTQTLKNGNENLMDLINNMK